MSNPETSSESTDSEAAIVKRPKTNHELLLRIYNRAEYTAIVRAIGAETWDVEDGRDLMVPLMKRFGVQRILDATQELLAIEHSGGVMTARLSDDARRYAVQLLGSKEANQNGATDTDRTLSTETPRLRSERLALLDPSSGQTAPDYVRVDAKLNDVVERFATHLTVNAIPFRRAKDVESIAKPRPIAFDFVIEHQSERQIVLVRHSLSQRIRTRLIRLLTRLGTGHIGVRVWPIQAEKTWMWEKEWILDDESPTPGNKPPTATPMFGESESATASRPTVQRELF